MITVAAPEARSVGRKAFASCALVTLVVVFAAPVASGNSSPALLTLSKPGLSAYEQSLMTQYDAATAWQTATYLSTPNDGWATRIGLVGKVSGQPEEAAAAHYVAGLLTSYGVPQVSVKQYITTSWHFQGTELRVASPEPGVLYPSTGEGLAFAVNGTIDAHGYDSMASSGYILLGHFMQQADGNWSYDFSNNQAHDGLVAPLAWAGEGTAKDFARAGDVQGKIVLILRNDGVTQWPTAPLFEAWNHGAAAVLFYGYFGENQNPYSVRGDIVGPAPIPAFETTIAVAHHLQSLLTRGPVTLSAKGTANILSDAWARSVDVIGIIPGWRYPNEYVVVGSQIDTWFYGPSNSNSGVATTLGLAKLFGDLAAHGQPPARSIVFALVGSEELGGPISTWLDWIGGSYALVKEGFVAPYNDLGKVMVADLNLANIGFTSVTGTHTMSGSWELQGIVKRTLRDIGLAGNVSAVSQLNPFSDLWSYSAIAGGSTFDCCGQPGYGKVYHTWNDTMADQSYWQYQAFGQYFAVLLYRTANSLIVPLDLGSTLSWVSEGVTGVANLAPESSLQSSYAAASSAVAQLQSDWQSIMRQESDLKSAYAAKGADHTAIENQAEALNVEILAARRDVVRWMVTTGGSMGGWWFYHRGQQYASDLSNIVAAQTALAQGNLGAAASALKNVFAMDWGNHMSVQTYEQIISDIEANLWWSGEWDQQPHYTDVRMDYQLLVDGRTTGVAQDLASDHALLVSEVGTSLSELIAALDAAHADWAS